MQSELYRTIIEKGIERGEHKALVRSRAETIVRILARRLGYLDRAVRARIEAETDLEVLEPWYDEALGVTDDASGQRLIDRILKAPPAQPARAE